VYVNCDREYYGKCLDADRDGYAAGTDLCSGPLEYGPYDCDDRDPEVHDESTRPCYSGPNGSDGVGTCIAGTEICTGGTWDSECSGDVLPSDETCAGLDDDCDGLVDEADPDCA